MGKTLNRVQSILLLILFILPGAHVCVAEGMSGGTLEKEELVIALIDTAFDGLSKNDAEAAFKAYVRTVGSSYGYDVTAHVVYFSNEADFITLSRKRRPDVVFFDTWNWVGITGISYLEPLMVTMHDGQVGERYLLLSKKFDKNSGLSSLKGSAVNVFSGQSSHLGERWLESFIHLQTGQRKDAFFSEITKDNDAMQVILPVFFEKKELAVIPENKFKLMTELNPQMATLSIVASSELFVSGIICMKKKGWSSERFHQILLTGMQEIHLKTSGRQLMTLLKLNQLVPFKPQYLDTVRQLKNAFVHGGES